MVVYSEEHQELSKIKDMVRSMIPMISEQKWNLHLSGSMASLKACMENVKNSDLLVFDITKPEALYELEQIRQVCRDTFLLIIANTDLSPMSYMKPSIKASSLLLRPIKDIDMQKVLKEFLVDFIEEKEVSDSENIFKIETKGELQYIPYHEIYYVEARKRRLYLRTLNEEYMFIDTMDRLEQVLGEQFIRCHRSFIVNARKIVGIALSEHMITLTNEVMVPFSRGYRNNMDKIIALRKNL